MRLVLSFLRFLGAGFLDFSDFVTRYSKPRVMEADEALRYRGIVRWGDGETTLALGCSTSFQDSDPELARELRRLLFKDVSSLVVCFPLPLLDFRPFQSATPRFRKMWVSTVMLMRLTARVRIRPTADALMFRNESCKDGVSSLFSLLVASNRILLVSSDPSYPALLKSQLKLDENSITLDYIKVPENNAYSCRNELLRELLNCEPPDIALLSAGPVGKCLIPELLASWPDETRIVDTGHLFLHLTQETY